MISSKQIIRKLQAAGWHLVRIRGDHHHFAHDEKPGLVTVPHPVKDVGYTVLKSIERQSGIKLR